jgi:signal transduction histidine kinase
MNKTSLKTKLSLFYGFIVVTTSLILGLIFVRYAWKNQMDSFIEKGQLLASTLAYNSRYGVYVEDPDQLVSLVTGVMRVEEVVSVTLVNAQGKQLAQQTKQGWTARPMPLPPDGRFEPVRFEERDKEGGAVFFYVQVIPTPTKNIHFPDELLEEVKDQKAVSGIGWVEVVLSQQSLQREMRSMQSLAVLITLLMIGGGMGLVYLASAFYVRPLRTLADIAQKVTAGDLTQTAKVSGWDEIGELTHFFNQMTLSLQKREKELIHLNASLESRVQARTIELEKAVLEIQHEKQKADQAKSAFIGQVSHGLRTPLTAIKGYLDNLKDGVVGVLTEKQQEYLPRIFKNLDYLNRLIGELLNISQMESGKTTIFPDQFLAQDLVEEVVAEMRPSAAEKGVDLFFNAGPLLPLFADRGKIEELLGNLIDNAIKVTPSGGKIAITTFQQGARVLITVQDTGKGIPEEEQAHIFDRFYRSPSAATTKGFGLGLFIARTIAELHGGTLSVASKEGIGSMFSLALPMKDSPSHTPIP